MATRRLTTGQALINYLAVQHVERDGIEARFFAGLWGIFGHGNIGGVAQAIQQAEADFPYYLTRNEQAMVHAAVGYAKLKNRLGAFACLTSIGPGATNMVTGAASATINHVPVLLMAGDAFAERVQSPVLQQLEWPGSQDTSANDTFRPVVRYWDRINRPEQLITALPEVMRILTSPGRHRRRVPRPPAGHPDLRLRLPGRDVREAHLVDPAQPSGPQRRRHGRRLDPGQQAPRHLRRRRRPLQRGDRRAARVRGADRASRSRRRTPARAPCPTTIR